MSHSYRTELFNDWQVEDFHVADLYLEYNLVLEQPRFIIDVEIESE
jgi:hypothetical protein